MGDDAEDRGKESSIDAGAPASALIAEESAPKFYFADEPAPGDRISEPRLLDPELALESTPAFARLATEIAPAVDSAPDSGPGPLSEIEREPAPAFGSLAPNEHGTEESRPAFGAHAYDPGAPPTPDGAQVAAARAPFTGIAPVAQPPERLPSIAQTLRQWIHDYFLGDDPTFGLALVPYCFLSMLLFTRHPTRTNFIFDEQEALLANPYVRSIADAQPKFRWIDAFHRDFWGLGPERSIGSYRPIPDLVWRGLWAIGARDQTPFLHHWVNVLLHGLNGALVCLLAFALTKRRGVAWIAGAAFTGSAVITEAVSGVVGIADVLGATGTLLALLALTTRLPFMAIGILAGTLFGLYSKESALCCVPLLPIGALLLAPLLHPEKPRRLLRAAVAFVTAGGAFVFYVYARRWAFPTAIPAELSVEANANKRLGARVFASILRWYAQPVLPKDPLNNPLVNADALHRIGGALRVWFRGVTQVVMPLTLSGDYSAPQEPIPPSLFSWEILLGALLILVPLPFAVWVGIRAFRRWHWQAPEVDPAALALGVPPPKPAPSAREPLLIVAFGSVWALLSYFPVSNIPVLLPTVRAERFWYFPVIGTSLIVGVLFGWLADRTSGPGKPGFSPLARRGALGVFGLFLASQLFVTRRSFVDYAVFVGSILVASSITYVIHRVAAPSRGRLMLVFGTLAFFLFQGSAARNHANDYTDDLSFWDATRKAVPRSAKAHLNYSVMKGARGDLSTRLESNGIALELAPEWPMASVYYGDTLCRLHRAKEAWHHYVKGFDLAPNDVNLIALGLQCLWDEKVLAEGTPEREELESLKDKHPGSWLEYLGRDIIEHGEEHSGVDPKYRPRGYNEGPKD